MDNKEELENNKKVISKLRPHYVFNVLWSIQYLIKHDQKTAEQMLVDFSTFFRGKINDLCYDGVVGFDDEIDQTKAYIHIEEVRSSFNIKAEYDLKFVDFNIPVLIIQPLVENALKHGLFAKDNSGTIKISTYRELHKVYIIIEDDGAGFDINSLDKSKCGNIFKIEERLKKHYEDASVVYDSTPGVGTKVTISYTFN